MARFNTPSSSFLLSLLGVGARQLELSLSVYGKLPVYRDFMRVNVAGTEAASFRAWLDRGFSRYWESDVSSHIAELPPHGFLIYLPGGAGVVFGRLRGSHDSGGLREFPLTLFASHPAGRGASRTLSLLHLLGQLLPALATVDRNLSGASSVDAVLERGREACLRGSLSSPEEVKAEVLTAMGECPVREFASQLFGAEAGRAWPALLRFVASEQAAGSLAVRVPLSNAFPPATQALFWSACLLRDEPRRQAPLSVLFPFHELEAGLTLVQRELRPDDTLLFDHRLSTYEHVDDLRFTVPGDASGEISMDDCLAGMISP